jgi:hypothetical protein
MEKSKSLMEKSKKELSRAAHAAASAASGGKGKLTGGGAKAVEAVALEPRARGVTTFEILSGANMPNMDASVLGVGSSDISDCYCKVSLVTSDAKLVASAELTAVCRDSLDPVWRGFVSFPCLCEAGDQLRVEVWDADFLSAHDFIGHATASVEGDKGLKAAAERLPPSHVDLPLVLSCDAAKKKRRLTGADTTTVAVRFVSAEQFAEPATIAGEAAGGEKGAPPPRKQRVFVIRHGESKWNDAQDKHDLKGMLKQVDHELDATGIDQVRAQACALHPIPVLPPFHAVVFL